MAQLAFFEFPAARADIAVALSLLAFEKHCSIEESSSQIQLSHSLFKHFHRLDTLAFGSRRHPAGAGCSARARIARVSH